MRPKHSNAFSQLLFPIAALFFASSILFYAMTLNAQESGKLKPLPKFLRNAKLAKRYLNTRDIEDILKFERKEPVCLELLRRAGVAEKYRLEAVTELAKLRSVSPVSVLVTQISDAIEQDKKNSETVSSDLAKLLPQLAPQDLHAARKQIAQLTSLRDSPIVRQAAFATLIMADGGIESTWQSAVSSEAKMIDVLEGAKFVAAAKLRKQLFAKALPLAENGETSAVQAAAIRALPGLGGDMRAASVVLSKLVANGKQTADCVQVLAQIPLQEIQVASLKPLCDDLIKYLETLTLSERAERGGTLTVELVQALSEPLGAAERVSVQDRVRRLSVQIFAVTAIEEKMAYDKTVLVVEAQRPVRIRFENHDIMPHNLVVGDAPNARVELGLLADEMQNDKDALAKGYLPESDMLLHATKLIQPGQTDAIDFVLSDPGVYPIVCTFPGHWSKMYGAIKVVNDVPKYLAANDPLPTADDLLGIRKVEWKLDDLAADLATKVAATRSFENGQRWFKQASCSSCHRMQQSGGLVGPDLTEISKKYKLPTEILTHIMNPSKTVEDKFASISIIDADGLVHQGVVLKRTDEEIYLQKNALEGCSPTVIRIEDIEEETKSRVSPMPENLLNTIVDRDEVYDLLAYIISGANQKDARFQ